jgi:hypothetical protein
MLNINGHACHETGCPNARKEWDGYEWVKVYECPECGSTVRESETCCGGQD